MTCTSNNICQCGNFQYHNLATLACLPQQNYSSSCSVDFNCRVDKYLQCVSGTCQCIPAYPFWSNGYASCIVPKIYNQYCYQNSDCNTGLNLVCHTSSALNCTCPIKINNNYCDCPNRVANSEYYWNGSSCQLAGVYGTHCTADYECQIITNSLVCDGSTSTCTCYNSIWSSISGSCIPCAAGWFGYATSCYKIVLCPPEFDLITQTDIDTSCGSVAGYSVVLAPSFTNFDLSWLNALCPAYSNNYYGVVNNVSCTALSCGPASLTTHQCNHGGSNHGIICMYY